MPEITEVLSAAAQGDPKAAEDLLPLIYQELHKLAAHQMAKEAAGITLQPTALVHEAWLRLVGGPDQTWQNRRHFFAAAAEAMRRILVDRARRKQRARHGGGLERVDVETFEIPAPSREDQLLALDESLELLSQEDPQKAEVVKLRYFAGLTNQEIADTLGLSLATVERYWAFAKAWLYDRMRGASR